MSEFFETLSRYLSCFWVYELFRLGIRNAFIQNFNPLELRDDIGGLKENFCVRESIKFAQYHRLFVNTYFWRTYDQKEIDYIEEHSGTSILTRLNLTQNLI